MPPFGGIRGVTHRAEGRPLSSPPPVVTDVLANDRAQLSLGHHHDMVQAISPNRSDNWLDIRVLPRGPRCRGAIGDPQHCHAAVDSRCAPQRIGPAHILNQPAQLVVNLRPAPLAALPGPVVPETWSMPANHRFRLHGANPDAKAPLRVCRSPFAPSQRPSGLWGGGWIGMAWGEGGQSGGVSNNGPVAPLKPPVAAPAVYADVVKNIQEMLLRWGRASSHMHGHANRYVRGIAIVPRQVKLSGASRFSRCAAAARRSTCRASGSRPRRFAMSRLLRPRTEPSRSASSLPKRGSCATPRWPAARLLTRLLQ